MRVGQKNKLTYRWARKGSRPRAVHDQRTQSTYLFGAVCPELGTGAALVLLLKNYASAYIERWNMLLGLVFLLIVLVMPAGIVPGFSRLMAGLRGEKR